MKHTRSEIVRCIVGTYLKKRKYSDNENFRKIDLPSTKNAESSAVTGLVAIDSSHSSSLMYKWVDNEPSVVVAQLNNFKAWINELTCNEVADELRALLFPLVCHFYLEMLIGGHKDAASSFLKEHQSLGNEDGFRILEELANIENVKSIEENDMLSSLRSSKYQVNLSSTTIQLLKLYLTRKAHVLLLQVINSWFDIDEIKSSEMFNDLMEQDVASQANGFQDQAHIDNDLAKLVEIIRLVNEGPSAPSPLLIYSVQNTDEGLSGGAISCDGRLLAGGFTTSEVRLWGLSDYEPVKKRTCPGSKIHLAVNTPFLEGATSDVGLTDDKVEEQNSFSISKSNDYVLRGHSGTVQDLAFLPKTDLLLSAGMDKTMRAWDLNKFECSAVYKGHNYPIWCIDVSPLPGFVVTGSHDRTARLWSMEYNYPLRIFAGHHQDVDCVRFHPNGNYIATGSSDNTVRLWSVDSGELVRVLDGHRSGILALAFSPDGVHLASAGDDKRIKVWDLRTSSITGEFRGHTDSVLSLSWSPNGDYLASCGSDSTARIWSAKSMSGDDEALMTPKIYNLGNANVFSIRYSQKNTPICIIGAKS